MHKIPLDKIVHLEDISVEIASQYQSRPLVEQHVRNLMLVASDDLPPISVVQVEQGYALLDGAHRVERARRLGDAMINAEFLQADFSLDMIKKAYLANQTHGLPDKVSRRVDFAIWLMQSERLSSREAARIAKCDHSAITRRKQKLEALKPQEVASEDENLRPLKRLFKAIEGLQDYNDEHMYDDIRYCLGERAENVEDLYNSICDIVEAFLIVTGGNSWRK